MIIVIVVGMFKEQFQVFKRRVPPPDLTSVLDGTSAPTTPIQVRDERFNTREFQESGLKHPSTWHVVSFNNHPGLILLRNPFTWAGQRQWITRCLMDYTRSPNRNNLTPHGKLGRDEHWYEVCRNDPQRKIRLINKLRWVTLGYQYNWDTKLYSEDRRLEFPPKLALLARLVARSMGGWDLSAQAGIINLYQENSTISGHVDRSEVDLTMPLISVSFGLPAILLVAADEMQTSPASAILLRSGDVIAMSGHSRLSLHGVPQVLNFEKIKEAPPRPWDPPDLSFDDDDDWSKSLSHEYISKSRINVSIRQVLLPGQASLS